MDSNEFKFIREKLDKTQQQMAHLLGTSLKSIQGYEQGWRLIPVGVERQLLFLLSSMKGNKRDRKPCWVIKKCPRERKTKCPAWEFKAGKLCWFINGTICEGTVQADWKEKMKICRKCKILIPLLKSPR